MRSIARWCLIHRRATALAWAVLLIGATVLSSAAGGSDFKDDFNLKGTESTDALALLQRAAPRASGDTDRIVMAVDRGRVTDPAAAARLKPMLAEISRLPHVGAVDSPFTPTGRGQVSRDGRV